MTSYLYSELIFQEAMNGWIDAVVDMLPKPGTSFWNVILTKTSIAIIFLS